MKNGFTLLEMLVVLAVFSILAIISSQTVIITLQGSKKSESLGKVKENLDYAIATMERQIRNATNVSCPSTTRIDYKDQNGISTYFSCSDVGSAGYIASGSARLTSTDVTISSCAITCTQTDPKITPYVTLDITAKPQNVSGPSSSQVTSKTQIFLRTY